MSLTWKTILRWLPALAMMTILFLASNTPGPSVPNFGVLDVFVKKGGHMLGYALLASTYWYGLKFRRNGSWLALILAVLYALTDEFHQSFISGRHPSLVDVFVFDGGGAAIALFLETWMIRRRHNPG